MTDSNGHDKKQTQPSSADTQETIDNKTGDVAAVAQDAHQKDSSSTPQTEKAEKETKVPFYKKWWFWVIIVVVVIGIIGGAASGGSNDNSTTSSSSSNSSNVNTASQSTSSPATEQEKAELLSAIDEAKVIDLTQYTNDSGASLTAAISNAEKVYADTSASSSDVESAITRLSSAKNLLKEKEKPVVLTGNGDDVVDIPASLSTCLVTAEYSGSSNFVIRSLDKNSDSIDLLVNTIGAYSGTTTTGMKNTTAVFLEVSASGPWTITLSPIADAQTITNGQALHGDNVVMASTGSASKLTITNAGKSNFVVYGISSSSSKLLVNEIGDYSGTVINNGYSMFIVQSEGDWTISW